MENRKIFIIFFQEIENYTLCRFYCFEERPKNKKNAENITEITQNSGKMGFLKQYFYNRFITGKPARVTGTGVLSFGHEIYHGYGSTRGIGRVPVTALVLTSSPYDHSCIKV